MNSEGTLSVGLALYFWFVLPLVITILSWLVLRIALGPVLESLQWGTLIAALAILVVFVFRMWRQAVTW